MSIYLSPEPLWSGFEVYSFCMFLQKRFLRLVYLIVMLVVGVFIVAQYWQTEQFTAIKQFSFTSMWLVFIYIALHMLKRFLWTRMRSWDYLYYLGLISIIAPVLWAKSSNEAIFHWMVDIGTCLFVAPVLADLLVWIVQFKKHNS